MKKRAPTLARSRGRAARVTAPQRGTRPTTARSRAGSKTGKSAKMTLNHDQIRRWAEARGGHPATVKRTVKRGREAGIIRIDFPGYSGAESLKPISWEEWFDIFEQRQLAFLYQDRTASGKQSRFNKLVSRE